MYLRYIYIYIYIHINTYIHVYIYIYVYVVRLLRHEPGDDPAAAAGLQQQQQFLKSISLWTIELNFRHIETTSLRCLWVMTITRNCISILIFLLLLLLSQASFKGLLLLLLLLSLYYYISFNYYYKGPAVAGGGREVDGAPPPALGEHEPGRIKPGRIERAALSLQSQNDCILCFSIRPRLYASDGRRAGWGLPSEQKGAEFSCPKGTSQG